MEAKKHTQDNPDDGHNANSAYSGSGTMQPGGGSGESGKLSDYPVGNLDKNLTADTGPEDQTSPEGRTMSEATDPSKLPDI